MSARRVGRARWARRTVLAAAIASLLAVALSGCPGHLDDPARFRADAGPVGCPDVPTEIFQARCGSAGCHGPTQPAAGLDLASPDVAARVVGVGATGCPGYVLAVPENPPASLLVQKLGPEPPCGSRMPLGGTLDDATIACVRDWIGEQTPRAATSAGVGGAGGAGGSGGADGSGGASAASGTGGAGGS